MGKYDKFASILPSLFEALFNNGSHVFLSSELPMEEYEKFGLGPMLPAVVPMRNTRHSQKVHCQKDL
jgi:hypothetical protein